MTAAMTAKEMTEVLMANAVENYQRDGNVHPAVMFTEPGGEQVIMSCACQMHPPDEMARATYAVRHLRPWRYVSTVMEAWSKESPPIPDDATEDEKQRRMEDIWREFPRGELQRRAEAGDETVKTVLVVVTYDPTDWTKTESLMLWPEIPDRERQATTGRPEGQAADDLIEAWENSPALPLIPDGIEAESVLTRSFAAAILARLGIAGSIVAHLDPDEKNFFES